MKRLITLLFKLFLFPIYITRYMARRFDILETKIDILETKIDENRQQQISDNQLYLTILKNYLRISNYVNSNDDLRIVIGASGTFEKDWCPTDIENLNLLEIQSYSELFGDKKTNVFLAEHVWEHLDTNDGLIAAKNCYQYLNKGGYMRIAVPDGFHTDENYIKYVDVGGVGAGADDHKVLYNYKTLSHVFEQAGFRVEMLEYFNENNEFIFNDWDRSQGMIHRSTRYDERNKQNPTKYTSIIIDAYKD